VTESARHVAWRKVGQPLVQGSIYNLSETSTKAYLLQVTNRNYSIRSANQLSLAGNTNVT
jgi:hypothetical protein